MARREYPEQPVVGVGGVVISDGRALLIRRGGEPLKGEWSIPGGTLELGETLAEGVARELREETGLEVRVLELIEAFERIFPMSQGDSHSSLETDHRGGSANPLADSGRPRYHFVILDYLCEARGGMARAGSDVTEIAFVREEELEGYKLTPTATRVVRKAFTMARARSAGKPELPRG